MSFRNLLVFLSYMLIISICLATGWEHCYDTGNFTANSTYARSRNLLLSTLASNIIRNSGFYNTTIGQDPDKVYGLALCRGDVSSEDCGSCVSSTSQDIMSTCLNQKEAFMWAGDPPCLVHYSHRSRFGKLEMDVPINPYPLVRNPSSNLTEFDQIWQPLMESTAREASMGSSGRKFATQEENLTSFQKIYALMQCTPDLSQSDCYFCLNRNLDEYKKCCHGKQGGGVQSANCMLRWDLACFYKNIDVPPPAPITIAEENGGIGIAAARVVFIVVSITFIMVLFSLRCFFDIRNNQGRKYSPFVKDVKEITNAESLQFDISTIKLLQTTSRKLKRLDKVDLVLCTRVHYLMDNK